MQMTPDEDTGLDVFGDEAVDEGFSKHLDGAIEAQDGPPVSTDEEGADGKPPVVEGTQETPKDGEAGKPPTQGDSGGQPTDPNAKPVQQQDAPQAGPPVKSDDKGNLIDKHGNVVVKAGSERRLFDAARKYGKQVQDLTGQLADAKKAAEQQTELGTLSQQYGLNNDETKLGLQVMQSLKSNPVETARWAIQEVMKMGHTLEAIVGGQQGAQSLQMDAIGKMIDERLQPVVKPQQEQQKRQEAEANAQRQYNEFISKHDHSQVHQTDIAKLMNMGDKPSAEVAYWRLREYASRNQLDFTQPLGPQVQAARTRATNQPPANGNAQPAPNVQQQHSQAPMPNGVAPPATVNPDETMANPNDGWDDIIANSMRTAGMQ